MTVCTHSGTREESSVSGNVQTTTVYCANPSCGIVISTKSVAVGKATSQ